LSTSMYIASECSKLQAQLKGLESTQLLEQHVRPFPPPLVCGERRHRSLGDLDRTEV
jgi:hypothetical protein